MQYYKEALGDGLLLHSYEMMAYSLSNVGYFPEVLSCGTGIPKPSSVELALIPGVYFRN